MNHITLDGVMQGPGRPDEDTRDGFTHGGWAIPRGDELIVAKMAERMGENRAFLFGRRSYEDMLSAWNRMGGPFKDALNNAPKYVASHSPATRLEFGCSGGGGTAPVGSPRRDRGADRHRLLRVPGDARLLGLSSAAAAVDLGDTLYDEWGWAFKSAGAVFALGAFWVQHRRARACAVDARQSLTRTVLWVAGAGVATYAAFYGFTTWLGSLAT
jgi:hypothetical protein